MILNISQHIHCNNSESFDNLVIIKRTCDTQIVPHIGEKIYNHMWKDDEGTGVADVCYDVETQTCDIALEKRVVESTVEEIKNIAKLHNWEFLGE